MTTKTDQTTKAGGLLSVCLVVAALYFARDVVIPIALAILFAFLLEPLAKKFEQWHLGRVASTLLAVIIAILVAGAVSYVVMIQLGNFGKKLPEYEKNIHEKIRAFKSNDGFFGHAAKSLQDFKKDLSQTNTVNLTNLVSGTNASRPAEVKPVPVEVRDPEGSTLQMIRKVIQPSLNFAVTLFLVTVFCIFILIERSDLRARLLHLVGSGNVRLTNKVLEDTGQRVGRYLLMQLIVNVSYGIPIALGLWAIGLPNPVLWGMLAALLRYVPYAGPWIAASMPFAIGIAVSSDWGKPAMVLLLFAVIEILTANLVEPWLYGNSTGITPLSVLLAAVFWTWLWGSIGLLLSMPLTVCLISVARYVPQLEWLDQLFGDTKTSKSG